MSRKRIMDPLDRDDILTINDHPAFIYFVGPSPEGPIKVGRTINISRRIIGLQGGCWEPLMVFGLRGAVQLDRYNRMTMKSHTYNEGAVSIETYTHRKLKEFGLQLVGEWFDVSAIDAMRVAEKVGPENQCIVFSIDDIMQTKIKMVGGPDSVAEAKRLVRSMAEANAFCHARNAKAQRILDKQREELNELTTEDEKNI